MFRKLFGVSKRPPPTVGNEKNAVAEKNAAGFDVFWQLLIEQRKFHTKELEDAVRRYPEQATAFVELLLDDKLFSLQRAIAVAAIYRRVFEDDTLVQRVRLKAAELGVPIKGPDFIPDVAPPSLTTAEMVHIRVSQAQTRAGDITFIVDQLQDPRPYRGRCSLTFDYDNDPREVWEIAECRTFVAKLSAALPWFPYVLDGTSPLNTFFAYLACLIPEDCIYSSTSLNLMDDAVIEVVGRISIAVLRVAELSGDDRRATFDHLLHSFPAEYRDALFEIVTRATHGT